MGAEPLQALHDAVVRPVGRSSEPGCGYRRWHLVSIDGSGLDVADEQGNADAFGRPGASRGASAFPQIRFVSLVENGTHVLFGSRLAGCAVGEQRLARDVVPALSAGMLCLADRTPRMESVVDRRVGTLVSGSMGRFPPGWARRRWRLRVPLIFSYE